MKVIIIPNMPIMAGRHYCIAKTLEKQGHEVHYFMWELPYKTNSKELIKHLFTSLKPKRYKYEKFIVHKAIRLPYFWPVINGLIFKNELRKLFKNINADIIFTESYTNETEVPKDLPFIYDLADDYAAPADIYGSKIYKLAFNLLEVKNVMKRHSENALAVTAVSEILINYAKQFNSNVVKLPNGVDTNIIQKVKKDKNTFPKNKHSMVYVTGFGEWSRAIETLEVIKKLKEEFKNLELTLIGKGIEVENIKKFIKDNKAGDYIHYLGFVSNRKKLFSLINNNAIGLNISDKNKWRDAAHPIKVLEYSALGKKVVSTDLEEVKKLHLPNVFIFSDKSKNNSLLNITRKALLDKKTQSSFKSVSQKMLKEYDWNKITTNLTNLIESAKQVSKQKQINRVIHVSHAYPPALGGLEKVVQTLARTQHTSGMNVAVITSKLGVKDINNMDDFPVKKLKAFVAANTRIMPMLPFTLLKLKRNDIVHLHISSAYVPEVVWLISKIKGYKYIAHLHLDLEPTGPAGILLKIYKPFVLTYVLRSASIVVVFTDDQKKKISKEYGITLTNIAVIPNGVEEKFYLSRKRVLHKKPRLLFVGRLEKQKNIQQLLQALKGISEKFETFLVGNGSLLNELKSIAKELELTGVNFVGRADGNRLLNFYRQSDIFVLPSEREGMPLALLEASAMGLPIAATDVTGSREIVKHNVNGHLVPLHNVVALRKSLLKMSSNKKSYSKLSEKSHELAKKYSWEKVAEQFSTIYEKVN